MGKQDNNLSSHLIYPGDKLNYSSSSSSSVEKLAQAKEILSKAKFPEGFFDKKQPTPAVGM